MLPGSRYYTHPDFIVDNCTAPMRITVAPALLTEAYDKHGTHLKNINPFKPMMYDIIAL